MAAAAILSITLVPVLMGYLIRGKIIRQDRNPLNVVLTWLYRPLLNGAIGMPILTVLLAVVVVARADEWACSMDREKLQQWLSRLGVARGTRDALAGIDGRALCAIDDDALFRLLGVVGEVQREGAVIHVLARRLEDHSALLGRLVTHSRDFH